jgi:DMSO/TMAO reductase YedYZ heme-binding membrane subunit
MDSLTSLSYAMDGVLILIGLWMAKEAWSVGLGGAMQQSTRNIVIGAAVLGLAHIIETTVLHNGMEEHANELLHRVIVLVGMVLLLIGIKKLLAPFNKAKQVT